MELYKVALFGHRYVENLDEIEERLSSVLTETIKKKEFVELYIGRNGEFDEYAASVIKRIQKRCGRENNALILVLPYQMKDIVYYEKYYDEIIIPIEKAHPKRAITLRNEWMIENADLVIVAVERSEGGANHAMKYAERLGKRVVNIL